MDKKKILEEVSKWDFAHRGLYDNVKYPENSLISFNRAVESGFAIELDVHLTKDEKLIICHDSSLKRMSNVDIKIEEHSFEELRKYNLLDTNEKMPEFKEMLNLVSGKVPLLIELKVVNNKEKLCDLVMNELADYTGLFVIESFFPGALRYMRKRYPKVAIGQLSGDLIEKGIKPETSVNVFINFLMKNLYVDLVSKPDFVAFKYESIYREAFKKFKGYKFSWTIRTYQDYLKCKENNITPIFERFNPKDI